LIPFSPPYIDEDIIAEVADTLRSGWITTGPKTKMLQESIASYCGAKNVLAVNSGTSALMLSMHWFGITKGDEVIIPAYTYCATALAVMHLGATPVMVDVEQDFTISPEKIASAITEKTKAVIAVDYGGWPCDYNAIYNVITGERVVSKFNAQNDVQKKLGRILLLSDAAHSFGASYRNKKTGALADLTVFSFHAVKNLTSAEGGAIVCNMPADFDNAEIFRALKLWTLNGQTKDAFTKSVGGGWKYDIVYPGFKMNMPDVLAAIAFAQLKKYESFILPQRKRVCEIYNQMFADWPWAIIPCFENQCRRSSYHLYPLRIKNISEDQRNSIIDKITKEKVSVNVHFIPMPMLTVFKDAGYDINDYPVSYGLYQNEISLPVYPQLTNEDCETVVAAVKKAVSAVRELLC
jgi:dTDP-4-amino-4,6-dideoxygalactose transaminase